MEGKIKWLKKPEDHSYPAAFSYLCLLFSKKKSGVLREAKYGFACLAVFGESMESEMQAKLLTLFESGQAILKSIGPSKRRRIDEIEIVFLDIVNGKNKGRRVEGFADILEALEDGSTPIGLIFVSWEDADRMESKEFPGLDAAATQTLLNSFAEAQDQHRADMEDS